MNWPSVKIATTCFPTRMRDPREAPEITFLYVDISSIDRNLKVITATTEILGSEAPSRARKEIHTGDVIVSTVRPNLNAVAIVPTALDGQIASTGFCVLRPNPSVIDSKYLFYFTLTAGFIGILTSRVRGAHYPAVSDGDVKEVELPLPSLKEQRRIVEIIDQANASRKKRGKADEKAKKIVPALFYKTFGDPACNSMDWEMTTLSKGGAKVRYGLGQPPAQISSGVPLIRATNICRGSINEGDMLFVDPEQVPSARNAFLRRNEVIVVRSGAYTGDVAQVTDKWEGSVAGYDLVITPGEHFCGEFLESYLLTPYIQKNYFGNLKARAGQPHLNSSQLSATPVPLVPERLQRRFTKQVHTIRQDRCYRESSKRILDKLFENLLYRVFSGDLTTKWREAHMKELLAEMEEQAKLLNIKSQGERANGKS